MNGKIELQIPLGDGDKVAETIRGQLKASSPEIFDMLGVRSETRSSDSLTLKLAGVQHINTVIIKYDVENDLYNLEFWNCRILNREPYVQSYVVTERKGVFCDQVAEAILRTVRQ